MGGGWKIIRFPRSRLARQRHATSLRKAGNSVTRARQRARHSSSRYIHAYFSAIINIISRIYHTGGGGGGGGILQLLLSSSSFCCCFFLLLSCAAESSSGWGSPLSIVRSDLVHSSLEFSSRKLEKRGSADMCDFRVWWIRFLLSRRKVNLSRARKVFPFSLVIESLMLETVKDRYVISLCKLNAVLGIREWVSKKARTMRRGRYANSTGTPAWPYQRAV